MKITTPSLLLFSFTALSACTNEPAKLTDVLGQANNDNLLCSNPNVPTKTCSALSAYSTGWTGGVVVTSEILIPGGEQVTVEMSGA